MRVGITGELDLATAPELNRMLNHLADDGHERVLIDLSELQFMDSTGLASTIRGYRCPETNGHRLTLRRGSPQDSSR